MTVLDIRIANEDQPHDLVIDASQGRECEHFIFEFAKAGSTFSVLVKTIGIGIAPKALTLGSDVVVLANDSVWVLATGCNAFIQHHHQFPVIDYAVTDSGLVVFDHIGCIMLDFETYAEKWRYHRSVLEDYSVSNDFISLTFDDGVEMRLALSGG